jgi:LCP family protein required for cell wall assembly
MGEATPAWRRGRRLAVIAASLALVAGVLGWAVLSFGHDEPSVRPLARPTPVSGPSSSPSPSPEPLRFELAVELGRVKVFSPARSVRPRDLREAAQRVRRTMEELYTVAFVDPDAWRDGRFPALPRFFASGEPRRQARKELDKLSLGRGSALLDAVRPRRAQVHVRFLADPQGRPVSAVAEMRFAGRALGEGISRAIRHRGRYVLRREDGEWRVAAYEVDGRVPTRQDLRQQRTRFQPGPPRRGLIFILAIGSDARPGQAVAGARADAIQIVAVNPGRRAASVVGIPRDSYVSIPSVGTRKINEALVYGGPTLMVRTVEQLTGIRFHGYLLTGFADFQRMVSRVGGVQVNIPYRMSDRYSGAYFQPGRKRLRGPGALAFARNRYDAPGGDFGRSFNQGRLILAALREFRRDFREDPAALFRWVVEGSRSVQTNLSLQEKVALLLAAPTIERVRNDVVSGSGAMAGGQSVVILGPQAQAVFRDIRQNAILGG